MSKEFIVINHTVTAVTIVQFYSHNNGGWKKSLYLIVSTKRWRSICSLLIPFGLKCIELIAIKLKMINFAKSIES